MRHAQHIFLSVSSAVLLLAGCTSTAPSASTPAGVGFGSYTDYQARREAELIGAARPSALVISEERSGDPADPDAVGATEAEQIAAAATAAIGRESIPAPAAAAPDPDNPALSDEQSFEAVASRESIESDADRLARQRAARQQVAPEPLPDRPSDTGPNIVEYALSTTNAPGQQVHDRLRPSAERAERNCAKYASPDRAQVAFMEAGGPERDRLGLDPDGDGFACAWSPLPFRAARGG